MEDVTITDPELIFSETTEPTQNDEAYIDMCIQTGQIAVLDDGTRIIGRSAALIKAMQRNPSDPWA